MARFFKVADGRAEARPYRVPTPPTVFEPFMKVDSEHYLHVMKKLHKNTSRPLSDM